MTIHIWIMYQFSLSVTSKSLQPHGLQHARPPCSSPAPITNLCPWSRWCHPTISSSFVPFSSFPQSFPASGSFPVSQLFKSGGQSIGASWVLPIDTQDWFCLGLTNLILQSKGLLRVFSNITVQKHQFFGAQLSSRPHSHIHTSQNINSSALIFLYGPSLTSVNDHWKNHSLD